MLFFFKNFLQIIDNKIYFYSDKITNKTKEKISFLNNSEIIFFENIRLNDGEIKLNNELILNLLNANKDKFEKKELIGIIYFKNSNLNNLFKLKDKNFEIKNNFEDFDIQKFNCISLIIEPGALNYQDINKINKYLYLCKEKIIGWFFVNSNIK